MRDALRAEWTKLRTSPGTFWLLLGVAAGTVGVSLLATSTAPEVADPAKMSLTGVQLGQVLVAILAVLAVGGEYGTGMVRVTLAALPRRSAVLAAKAAVITGVVAAAAVVAVAGSLASGRLMPVPPSMSDGAVLRAATGSVLYLALIGLLALGVATVVRNSAAAIGVVLGLLYLFPIVTQALSDEAWKRHLAQVSPMSAGLAVQATAGLDGLPIGPWQGLGVLAAWAAGALLLGTVLLELRDA